MTKFANIPVAIISDFISNIKTKIFIFDNNTKSHVSLASNDKIDFRQSKKRGNVSGLNSD